MIPSPEKWMARALELAARGRGATRPNPVVGAVLLGADGEMLGEGWHHGPGLPHAEVEALRDARSRGLDPRGGIMFVTLEPCNHHGRTPPCTEAILEAGIATVVIAQRDPNIQARGGVERLRDAGIRVEVGCLADQAIPLNAPFNVYHSLKRPLFTIKWAMTLDGCTSVPSGDSKWITGEFARREVHRRRAAHDAVLAGIGTVLADKARLTARLPSGDPAHSPTQYIRRRVLLDGDLRLPTNAPFLEAAEDGSVPVIFCREGANKNRHIRLEAAGATVIPIKASPEGISLACLAFHLFDMGIQSVYVEGGRRVAGSLVRHGMADRVEAWLAPRLAGGATGFHHLGPLTLPSPMESMGDAIHLRNLEVSRHGADLLLEGWLLDWAELGAGIGAS